MLLFNNITIIGAGLIGSSLARAVKQLGLVRQVTIGDINPDHCAVALQLGFADVATEDLAESVESADMVVLATPMLTFSAIMQAIAPHLPQGCIVTDTGSVKSQAITDITPHVPPHASYVPGHPIAGTEHSGPHAGFAELFQDRWFAMTPTADTPLAAMSQVQGLWEGVGCQVTTLDVAHHDSIFAFTSHLPTLLAFALVNTAIQMGEADKNEVLQFAASGFRGATRLAAQDPIVWRDVFILNKDALLAQLERLQQEIAAMTHAIRWNDVALLEERMTQARDVRQGLSESATARLGGDGLGGAASPRSRQA